ncbi:glycosyltransferase [Parapedobacter sp. GCM10030251]|uniref:glycosyltransferase n=1 Tax=Parapedobacter sp. GCM10030251 TaxID=3273419 RepID=UPI003617AF82
MRESLNPYVTVFTPVYNRARYLGLLYESLIEQHFHNFEWIIVDDGSTDGTREIVARFVDEGRVRIRYHYQENAGKHVAVNRGVQLAKGELFFIVDSDDTLTAHALSTIVQQWQTVLKLPDSDKFAGVCGLRIHKDGTVIGGDVDYETLDVSCVDYRFKYHYKGDRAEVILTTIMQQYPYPQIAGERFCADALVWNRIGKSYMLRYFNEGIYVCEYLRGGITDTSVFLRKSSPKGASLYYAEMAGLRGLTEFQRLKAIVNFWRFAVYDSDDSFSVKRRMIRSNWSFLIYPLAWTLRLLRVKVKLKE